MRESPKQQSELKNPVLNFGPDTAKGLSTLDNKNILSPEDSSRRAKLEGVIKSGLKTFVKVGIAFLEICDSRLYRNTHLTFERYCRDRWKLSKTQVNRSIQAAKVTENLADLTPMGVSERQLRPLTILEPDQQREAYKEAVEQSDGNPTARDVQAAVDKLTPAITFDEPSPITPIVAPGSKAKFNPRRSFEEAVSLLGEVITNLQAVMANTPSRSEENATANLALEQATVLRNELQALVLRVH